MSNGKWFLIYDEWDRMESIGNESGTVSVELSSTDQSAALEEAQEKWSERIAGGTYDAGSYSGVYPRNPRLIYEVRL